VAQVTSIVRDRGREIGIVAILVMSVALLSAPTAFGAGDPIASGTFSFKQSGGFKHQLKKNHVKLTPKKFSIKAGSSLDPITGAGSVRLGKITFKKGNKKVVYSSAKATLGANGGTGNIKGSTGKVFSLKGGKVARNGFGATISGVKVKLLKGAAKKINRKLGLHSLHKGSAGSLGVTEQPQTVQIVSGTAYVDVPLSDLGGSTAGTSVTGKLDAHCINPVGGAAPIAPATLTLFPPSPPSPPNTAARFTFPVAGGTISPAGNDGVLQQQGGVHLANTLGGAGCPPAGSTTLDQKDFAVNLALLNIQADVVFGGTIPGNFLGGPGDKGIAIGQVIDPAGVTVSANPTTHTITVDGGTIKNNAAAAQTLNTLFPRKASEPASRDFADGDTFGRPSVTVTVR
jgi:hypothetical protein